MATQTDNENIAEQSANQPTTTVPLGSTQTVNVSKTPSGGRFVRIELLEEGGDSSGGTLLPDIPVYELDSLVQRRRERQGDSATRSLWAYHVVTPDLGAQYIISSRSPEEVFALGLQGDDLSKMSVPSRGRHYVSPVEHSIFQSQPRHDGLCVYCQLALQADAPEFSAHHPTFHDLVVSQGTCHMCRMVLNSLSRKNPELTGLYQNNYPLFFDRIILDSLAQDHPRFARWRQANHNLLSNQPKSAHAVVIHSRKFDTRSEIVAHCGTTPYFSFEGEPLVWTTRQYLGPFADRTIWEDHSNPNRNLSIGRSQLFQTWVRACVSEHEHCNRYFESLPQLPSRVLEISRSDKDSELFRLRLVASKGRRAPYTTLSHCWGHVELLSTRKANLNEHEIEILFSDLPLTFQDAVRVSFILNCQYIWIDSLCIVQDDEIEWQTVSAQMADIYSGALVTIAASAAADSSEGLTTEFPPLLCVSLEADISTRYIRYGSNYGAQDNKNTPLNTRAWAFQEDLLSRRYIQFNQDQLLWKCTSRVQSEDGLLDLDTAAHATPEVFSNIWTTVNRLRSSRHKYAYWYRLMEQYSKRHLTFQRDKLATLEGISTVFQGVIDGDEPVVGLWKSDLVNGLLWRSQARSLVPSSSFSSRAEEAMKLPSWSWASIQGPVEWEGIALDDIETSKDHCIVTLDSDIRWASVPMTSRLLVSTLRVQARMIPAVVSPFMDGTSFHLHPVDSDTDLKSEISGYCQLEGAPPSDSRVWCLEICAITRSLGPDVQPDTIHKVLVLVPVDPSPSGLSNTFRRLGMGNIWRISYHPDRNGGVDRKEGRPTFTDVKPTVVALV